MIIELFVEAMRGSDSSAKLDQLRRQEKALLDRTFLSPVQRRQLARVRKEIGDLQQEQPDKFYDDARRQMMMLPLMRGVRVVSMAYTCLGPIEVPCLVLTTSPIAINGIALGTYDFWFQPKATTPKDAFFLRRRDHKTEQGPHPHWNGYGCFGTYGPVFQSLLGKKQYGTLLGTFMQYLAVYDAGSPLIRLDEFEERAWQNENPLA
jgi:hypothetical protein